MRPLLLAVLTALLLAGCPHDPHEPAKVSGEVHDYLTSAPIARAAVWALDGKQILGKVRTDDRGKFQLADLPSRITLEVSAAGHLPLSRAVVLASGEDRGIDLYLVPPGYQLPNDTILFERGGHIWKVDPAGLHAVDLTADMNGTQDSPTWNKDRTRFAFINRIPGRTKIYTRSADGTDDHFLANVPDSASELTWCSDGRQMIFTVAVNSTDLGTTTDLQWFDAFTGRQRDLVGGAAETDPAWSPDGHWIVWSRHFPSQPSELWLTQSTGGDQHPFLRGYNAVQPTWSPDGQRIAFASNLEGQWDLYEAALENPNPTKLTAMPPGGYARDPQFSPIGDKILFVSNVHLGKVGIEPDLFALNLRTKEVHEVIDDARDPVW